MIYQLALHFISADTDTPITDVYIETILSLKEVEMLGIAISNIKEHADRGESLSDFVIPANWDTLSLSDKLEKVCTHMSAYTERFKIIPQAKSCLVTEVQVY
ncbi:MAG: hypothetical protein K6D02_01825 [Lachnospiraceae bacterium]|nr:hypothetical protein [Lachnospiraceae bacterium]